MTSTAQGAGVVLVHTIQLALACQLSPEARGQAAFSAPRVVTEAGISKRNYCVWVICRDHVTHLSKGLLSADV